MKTIDCLRCGRQFADGLLLNHRTKHLVKVVQLCPLCCRDALIGLKNNRRVPFGYLRAFQEHFQHGYTDRRRSRAKRV